MKAWICRTCGVQQPPSDQPPPHCPICEDERQYVGTGGQLWTNLEAMAREGHRNEVREIEEDLFGVGTEPTFAIGQRALLVRTSAGNLLWDCVSYIDDPTVAVVEALGGVAAIGISHPHFYASMIEWSRAFGGAPLWLPEADREWIQREEGVIRFYRDRQELLPGLEVLRCGGHFPGSSVLHWRSGPDGKGALLVGDTLSVTEDRRHVSFMYSYPNLIPLSPGAIRGIVQVVKPLEFEKVYGGWWGKNILCGAREAVLRSAERYLARIEQRCRETNVIPLL